MAYKIGKRTIGFDNKPHIISYGSAVGKKEHEGPLSEEFDYYSEDSLFGQESFEKAESQLQKTAINIALQKANLKPTDIDKIFAGDLLNQCIGSSFGIREFGIPFLGLYGACSTMALSTGLASLFIDSGAADRAIAVTSSHFCSAERQYRFPLDYGSQRTPTAQWTVTGSGALILQKDGKGPYINAVTFGEIEDLGITDANNMGAAMALYIQVTQGMQVHTAFMNFATKRVLTFAAITATAETLYLKRILRIPMQAVRVAVVQPLFQHHL